MEAYPLHWPAEYPRTKSPGRSRFTGNTLGRARDFVMAEIARLGAKNPVISTNVPLKNNGELRADWSKYKMDDHGAAVYFTLRGNPVCLCCDKYEKVWDNLRAIARTIEALRQIDRDGVSDFLNRAFTGFKALPHGAASAAPRDWREVLGGVKLYESWEDVKTRYRDLCKKHHPDVAGGDADKFKEVQDAYEEAKKLYQKIHNL